MNRYCDRFMNASLSISSAFTAEGEDGPWMRGKLETCVRDDLDKKLKVERKKRQ